MKQKMEMENLEERKEVDKELLQDVLSNPSLIKWVSLNGCDNIKDELPKEFKEFIQTTKNSLFLLESSNVAGIITNANFNGKAIARYSLEYLNKIAKILGEDAVLVVFKENFPAVIQNKNNLCILAPRVANSDED